MISSSFIFLDKIGLKKEKEIWNSGISSWKEFINAGKVKGISRARKSYYNSQIIKMQNAVEKEEMGFIKKLMPENEAWRLYPRFKDDAAFVDIETSGKYGDITIIGVSDGEETKTLVRGFNLDFEFMGKLLHGKKIALTFNGSSFDMPIINRYFQKEINIPHIDLRHVCSKLGLVGGLKNIEKTLGIMRPEEAKEIKGEDAPQLWQMYQATGDYKYLNLLIQYNTEDAKNLKQLADYAVPLLWKKIRENKEENCEQ